MTLAERRETDLLFTEPVEELYKRLNMSNQNVHIEPASTKLSFALPSTPLVYL